MQRPAKTSEFVHSFYQQTRSAQNRWLAKFGLLLALVAIVVTGFCYWAGFHFLGFAFSAFLLSAFASFFDTPGLVRKGALRYYSPLLLAEREKKGSLHLHGGSLFDYYFVLRHRPRSARRRLVLQHMLKGLLTLRKDYPATLGSEPKIYITSYFFKPRTAQKLGFVPKKREQRQMLKFVIGFPQIFLAYSLLAGRPKMPPLSRIATYQASPQSLAKAKEYIAKLEKRMAAQDP